MADEKIESVSQTEAQVESAEPVESTENPENKKTVENESFPTKVIVQSNKTLYLAAAAVLIVSLVFLTIFFGPKLLSLKKQTVNLITPAATSTSVATAPASTKSASILTQNCTNSIYKYSLEYPITWFTTQRTEKERCQYFAPSVFSFPKSWDGPLTPILIRVVPTTEWEKTKITVASSSANQKVLQITDLKIDDALAQRIESKFTGEGLFDEGAISVTYIIDHPTIPILAQFQTTKADDPNAADYTKILDNMAKSLKFL